ncbi:MAG: acyl-CoA/sterol acyltransferase [Piccolia ochrophora]|nr:MAG: acyl-CoA/sterol acyltransferase [Piccolia ochrophora]
MDPQLAKPRLDIPDTDETPQHLIARLDSDGVASFTSAMDANVGPTQSPRGTTNGVKKDGISHDKGFSSSDSSERSSVPSSDEDYDALEVDPSTMIAGAKGGGYSNGERPSSARRRSASSMLEQRNGTHQDSPAGSPSPLMGKSGQHARSISIKLEKTDRKGKYTLRADDYEIRDILRRTLLTEGAVAEAKKRRRQFRDLVFTRQFTAFDRQNPASADSPFHGFFTLFWLGTTLLILKVAAENWRDYGSVFGRKQILGIMFHHDVILLGVTDGLMCGATSFGFFLQRTILKGWLSWNKQGWILQNVWQACFLAGTLSWAWYRDWSWTHEIFIVLHCLVMLMKQHSYAFYNGYLSELYKRRELFKRKLKQLEDIEPAPSPSVSTPRKSFETSPSAGLSHRRRSITSRSTSNLHKEQTEVATVAAALESGAPLDIDQVDAFERIIKEEIEELTEELNGKCESGETPYPRNLTLQNWAEWTILPTLVYELEYPRQESINWFYVAEKTVATFGCIGVMIIVSEAFMFPPIIRMVEMRQNGVSLEERLHEFPWLLSDLLFPFMMEYMLSWYVIWECVLNVLAEVTRFADRGFYADWWNSTSWDQFARDWNRPVHNFLLRHVYHSSISALQVSKPTATLMTFFLSACVHELVMWSIFKKLRGYLMVMQMMQLPLVVLSRTKLLRERKLLGNVIFWLGIFTGPTLLCSLYVII